MYKAFCAVCGKYDYGCGRSDCPDNGAQISMLDRIREVGTVPEPWPKNLTAALLELADRLDAIERRLPPDEAVGRELPNLLPIFLKHFG